MSIQIIMISALLALVALVVGILVGRAIKEADYRKQEKNAKAIIDKATKEAEDKSKSILDRTYSEVKVAKAELEDQIKEHKFKVEENERKITQREDLLNKRFESLDRREVSIEQKENRIDTLNQTLELERNKVEDLIKEQQDKLLSISNLTREEARNEVFERVRTQMAKEITEYIVEQEEEAKDTASRKAKEYITSAIQKYANEVTSDKTISVVSLPNDEMKGRIIGREGRNIRAIEALTGVDLIIDDTPDAVVLSCFDPVRREIARYTLESLVNDGRIHPAKIEEAVDKATEAIEELIMEKGRQAVFETGIGKINKDLIRLLGRLHFRTSYGQNVLKHSIEVAMFAGKMAAEIGEDEILARRAGLLHDIGKALDHEIEGSHVEIGVKLAEKYQERPEVINAIASHHGDVPVSCFIADLVSAADTLSAARPGARSEAVQNYFERIKKLEDLSKSVSGVEEAFAISAGREIRVLVKPDDVDDLGIYTVAREIKKNIEENLTYPGTVKVTVIREQRAIDVAK